MSIPVEWDGGYPDPLRCRYDDCREQHPIALNEIPEDDDGPSERVTCPTCRKDMGLPPIDEP